MEKSLFKFSVIEDERGALVALESLKSIPFEIKRVYYIYNVKNSIPRGFHAHKNLQQMLVCVAGSCKVILDNGKEKKEFILNQPNQGLFIDKMIWREMHDFSEDCILLVLASDYYDEDDYIRNYEEFLNEVGNNA
ncbi:sugar 3,4-ketoisomerase [Thermaerobacillus caldiproteolyticus]|uniref:sugar 3,4-ketoisomerase n=1 Tax=Thermaerobacillus caldiproteolyticus TaxID=247480 RepID=UPI00188C36B6|nr:FdtA/QdtA family cupin domain-containing protein [Anoxybacillus caldiproteolyticus]QPA30700.1 WxcM-like domain-containing protein [Anoxybacillus caldiproteolyticus]